MVGFDVMMLLTGRVEPDLTAEVMDMTLWPFPGVDLLQPK
jgi:hypothetical protein